MLRYGTDSGVDSADSPAECCDFVLALGLPVSSPFHVYTDHRAGQTQRGRMGARSEGHPPILENAGGILYAQVDEPPVHSGCTRGVSRNLSISIV